MILPLIIPHPKFFCITSNTLHLLERLPLNQKAFLILGQYFLVPVGIQAAKVQFSLQIYFVAIPEILVQKLIYSHEFTQFKAKVLRN